MINAKDVARTVAGKLGLTEKISQEAVDATLEAIRAELVRGGEANFRNLFRISVKLRKGHPVKEVNTGKHHPAKDYFTPVCYFSKNVKDAVKNNNR